MHKKLNELHHFYTFDKFTMLTSRDWSKKGIENYKLNIKVQSVHDLHALGSGVRLMALVGSRGNAPCGGPEGKANKKLKVYSIFNAKCCLN